MVKIPGTINLSGQIEKQLPAELAGFIQTAGEITSGQGQSLYLVGGVVRDLLLGRANLDLDLVVEGSAIDLAQKLAPLAQGKITTHPRFNTAKLRWHKWGIDLTTARSETYARPGALPRVKPGPLNDDLFRRDFTINAMAVHLAPGRFGELIDLYGGRDDLKHRLIRILHEKSFIDDATRIWRGLRYEQRLGFKLEPATLMLLKRDIDMLDTISGDRIRYELECILGEESPEKALRRAEELGALAKLHPSLRSDRWLEKKFGKARGFAYPNLPPQGLYLAFLTHSLTSGEIECLISYLRLPKSVAQIIRDTASIKARLESLADPELAPSRIYHLLHGYAPLAIVATSFAADSPVARRHIELYLDKLRYISTALNGNDLKEMGIAPGLQIKEILNLLREARLDGKVTSKQAEIELARGWIAERTF